MYTRSMDREQEHRSKRRRNLRLGRVTKAEMNIGTEMLIVKCTPTHTHTGMEIQAERYVEDRHRGE